jgi:hypothetical protein
MVDVFRQNREAFRDQISQLFSGERLTFDRLLHFFSDYTGFCQFKLCCHLPPPIASIRDLLTVQGTLYPPENAKRPFRRKTAFRIASSRFLRQNYLGQVRRVSSQHPCTREHPPAKYIFLIVAEGTRIDNHLCTIGWYNFKLGGLCTQSWMAYRFARSFIICCDK